MLAISGCSKLPYLAEADGADVLGVGGGRSGQPVRGGLAGLGATLSAAHALYHLRSRERAQ